MGKWRVEKQLLYFKFDNTMQFFYTFLKKVKSDSVKIHPLLEQSIALREVNISFFLESLFKIIYQWLLVLIEPRQM